MAKASTPATEERWVSPAEVCRTYSVSLRTLRGWRSRGLPGKNVPFTEGYHFIIVGIEYRYCPERVREMVRLPWEESLAAVERWQRDTQS
jgi:hypothetical protein